MFHSLNRTEDEYNTQTFGLKTPTSPPRNQLIYEFESDLYNLVENVEFKKVNNNFQKQMFTDLKSIKQSGKIFVQADKTRNMYGLDPAEYEKLLHDNVTKSYKKCNMNVLNSVNKEAASIAENLNLSDRIQVMTDSPAFVTIKDHKPDFPNRVSCRLLNPCKSHIGKISKQYLEKINNDTRESTNANQWRNSRHVIDWFKEIPNKSQSTFIKFDIVSFYSSISLDLLMKAIEFAKEYSEIDETVTHTIINTHKSFLYYNGEPWIKKDGAGHFDVTEGCFDGAEVCELVGLYFLHKLEHLFTSGSIGLYRDDGLAVCHNFSGPRLDRLRKDITKVFKDHGLQITIDINLKSTEFLDIKFDLTNDKYFPYKKPNDTPLYVHRNSNHPPTILKQIPTMTSKRLSSLSCDENEFKKVASEYELVLKNSGFNEKLNYVPSQPQKKQRKRNILWYNPPFDLQVKTNLGKQFLSLLDKHFPPHHKLSKILNRNTVKLSYSCMQNIASRVSSLNVKQLNKYRSNDSESGQKCNCSSKAVCPLNGECLSECIIYQADAKPSIGDSRKYIGLCEPSFKGRYGDHTLSMKHRKYSTKTELSNFYWSQKDHGHDVEVSFSKLCQCSPYRSGAKYCNLCLWEKFFIMKGDGDLLNKRDELVSKCRHTNKFLLKNFKKKLK